VFTDADLKASKALQEAAKNFKMPLKSSLKSNDEEIEEMLALMHTEDLYKQKVVSPSDLDKIKTTDLVFLTEVIQGMEEKLEAVTRKTSILYASTEQVAKKVKVELPIIFSKTSSLDATIGKQVNGEKTEFVAPTLWSCFYCFIDHALP
jgi:3-methyladenine DNA glycosylase AlkC